jgi:serine/threonine protein kinase
MTRNYFAPELLISSRYDSKVDIWSAGCILYELGTGSPAFANDEAVRRYVWSGDDPPQVSKIRDNLGSEIDEMISVMLNVSSELRPDAKVVLEDIPLLADVSVEL